MDDDAVSVSAQSPADSAKSECLRRSKLKTCCDKEPAGALLEVVPAVENLAGSGGEFGFAPPFILDSAHALVADTARTQVGTRQFRCCGRSALHSFIERDVDRLLRQLGLVIIEGHLKSRSGLERGPD